MKATLEFNLPEEQHEFDMCNKALSYYCALEEFGQKLRSYVKHGDDSNFKEKNEAGEMAIMGPISVVERLREEFWDIVRSHNIEL